MSAGAIHYTGERLTSGDIRDIVKALEQDAVRVLSIRKCRVSDKGFAQIIQVAGDSKTLYQLNLNMGIMTSVARAEVLSSALLKNRSLTSLFLHGSGCGDEGIIKITEALAKHPRITDLDLGDCHLTDLSIPYIARLFAANGAKPGLKELTLSANTGITLQGWSKLFVAMGSSNTLHTCHLDYNNLGDHGAMCLAVALATNKSLRVLDLESAAIGDNGAQTLLYLVQNFNVNVSELVLEYNPVSPETVNEIYNNLRSDAGSSLPSSSSSDTETGESSSDDTESSTTENTTKSAQNSPTCSTRRPSRSLPRPDILNDATDSASVSSSCSFTSQYVHFKQMESDIETEKSIPVEIIALRGRPEFMDNRKASRISFGDAKTYAIISQRQNRPSISSLRRRSVKIQTDLPREGLHIIPSPRKVVNETSRSDTVGCMPVMQRTSSDTVLLTTRHHIT